MSLAPVIAFDTARRRAIARRLLDMGVPLDRIVATRTDRELADLWTRERTLRSLQQLTGYPAGFFKLWDTGDLFELERRCYSNLMGSDGRSIGGLIFSIAGRMPRHPRSRRRQKLAAWNSPA